MKQLESDSMVSHIGKLICDDERASSMLLVSKVSESDG